MYFIDEKVVVPAKSEKRLDRQKWHKPLISIIVTHHNYSDHLEDALLSILDQTHENWECVVVDDASTPEHRMAVETIISDLSCEKIRFLALQDNVGQIPAFFAGLDMTTGEFVCLLDPDDRYETTFLEEMLKAHLNDVVFCPVVCCDQRLLKNGAVLSGVNYRRKMLFITEHDKLREVPAKTKDRLLYFPADVSGWLWTSTSSIMFRRPPLDLVRPYRPLAYKMEFDSYTAQGAHRLGGSLILTTPLVYRGVHSENAYLTPAIFASTQDKAGLGAIASPRECLNDVLDAIVHNGGGSFLQQHPKKQRGVVARWRRSVAKRWKMLKSFSEQGGA